MKNPDQIIEDFEKKMKNFVDSEFEKRNSVKLIKPTKNPRIPYPLIFPILIPLVFPVAVLAIFFYFIEVPGTEVRHIEVNGQDCHIEYVMDRVNSHGGPVGHDRAVCP